jgi:PhnB protein
MGQTVTPGNNFYIAIFPESKEEANRLFNGLSAEGKIETPLQDMFWGAYYGSFADKFGVQWMVNYDKNQSEMSSSFTPD